MVQISDISEYNLGGDWDLFKEPQPIMEQPLVSLNHMTSTMSMFLCSDDVMSREIKSTEVESFQNDYFLSNLFYGFEDILSKEPSSPSQILNFKLPETETVNNVVKENLHPQGKITKSVSSDSLISMNGAQVSPNSVKFSEMEDKKVYGMRRAFSEGHIKVYLSFFLFFFSSLCIM